MVPNPAESSGLLNTPPAVAATALHNTVTAKLTSPIAVPTYGAAGVFAVSASTFIAASPSAALDATLDPASYPRWNSFIPAIEIESAPELPASDSSGVLQVLWRPGHLQPGTVFTTTVYMAGRDAKGAKSRKQRLEVTFVGELTDGRKGYFVAWRIQGYPQWVLTSERVQEFVQAEDGGTEYVNWETFGGFLAPLVRVFVGGMLVKRFEDCARDLKAFLEKVAPA